MERKSSGYMVVVVMDSVLELARWQFGIVTVYHFLFVPLTVGLTMLVAVLETIWLESYEES